VIALFFSNLVRLWRERRERRRLLREGRIIDLRKYPFDNRRRW